MLSKPATKRRKNLYTLWQAFISQTTPVSDTTHEYVAALRMRVDSLEFELAQLRAEVKFPKANEEHG